MNITAVSANRPSDTDVLDAIECVSTGRYSSCCWPGYLKIYRDEKGDTVIENLEESK